MRPYYRREDLAGLGAQTQTAPGSSPLCAAAGKAGRSTQARSGADAIRAEQWHEAGADAVQELGYALAAGVERLSELAGGQPVDEAARRSNSFSRLARPISWRSPSCAPRA